MEPISLENVTRNLSVHIPLYSWHRPVYQHVMLETLQRFWDASHRSALDVGGGTGVVAQTIKNFFCLERVASVDVENRFLKSLNIETAIYDGRNLPFPDASFDCIILMNVLHHVPKTSRLQLLRECKRVAGAGPLYIKDHVSAGYLDTARLTVLDLLGNVPFQGMLQANYSTAQEWSGLAAPAGYSIIEQCSGPYRNGLFAKLFPNRLETTMKWRPI